MSESLYSSGDILVTRTIAKFGETTYTIANIGSVAVKKKLGPLAVWVLFLGMVLAMYLSVTAGWFAALVVLVGVGLLSTRLPKTQTLTLKTSSGDVTALESTDAALVRNVKSAIENAFSTRTYSRD